MPRRFFLGASLLVAAFSVCSPAWAAKNVILMITDGGGYNQWLAASLYQGRVGRQVYDQPGWVRWSACTYPLNLFFRPTGNDQQLPFLVYDPAKAWDATVQDTSGLFAGYVYLTTTYTDSAAAATALATGRKTYNHAINWSNEGRPFLGQTIAEIAKARGKSVGVITSVPWSHATPAGLGGAHNINRDHYAEIAREMLGAAWLDVMMGAGHPDFDDNGKPLSATQRHDYKYVGGQDTWTALKSGKLPWKLIEKKSDFESLTSGATPAKLVGTAQVGSTLQEKRGRAAAKDPDAQQLPRKPFTDPKNANVPSLATMARAAINGLDDNPQGFYLMIEGGAVDWANHANEPDRMIEEQIDFVQAVEAVVAWIESHGGWDQTLLILTADHESGLLWGPDSNKIAFQPLQDRGPDQMPGLRYNSHGHANSLVPVYARGPGSQRFAAFARNKDEKAAARWGVSGRYLDNIDIFRVMRAEVDADK